MRRRVQKTAILPPFPHALTEVLTCIQFPVHSDLPCDIPFICFLFPQYFFSFSFPTQLIFIQLLLNSKARLASEALI